MLCYAHAWMRRHFYGHSTIYHVLHGMHFLFSLWYYDGIVAFFVVCRLCMPVILRVIPESHVWWKFAPQLWLPHSSIIYIRGRTRLGYCCVSISLVLPSQVFDQQPVLNNNSKILLNYRSNSSKPFNSIYLGSRPGTDNPIMHSEICAFDHGTICIYHTGPSYFQ